MEENGGSDAARWSISRLPTDTPLAAAGRLSIRPVLNRVFSFVDASGPRPVLVLGGGDPTASACFRTAPEAEDAIVDALRSREYNGYSPNVGVLPARSAIADYLSRDLPYKLSADDIYLTSGCCQAIEVIVSVLAQPGSNILLPRPGFPLYEGRTTFSSLDARHFDLIPDRGWEVDLEALEALADENTVAMVIVNPGNPCGSVYSYDHLAKIAETARKLGIVVIADEVYDHLTFGDTPFIPMGVFAETVPVITLGSISKRWLVPGWRLGWIATCDPKGVFKETKVCQSLENYINITSDPATFIQGAVPQIIANTKEDYFNKIIDLLRKCADICYSKIKETRGITCPHKPEGSMFVMAKLDLACLDGIHDDDDFCCKLAKEESVIVLPGAGTDFVEQSGWDGLWERTVELVMWRNVAKSALWFGCGSMFFSCSCSREITFSPISALCHLGVVILGLAFFKDSVPQRPQVEKGRSFQLTEEDVLRASRAVLPVANSMISTAQVIFSGEPLMTLKVLPVLLFGAKYGSLVTVWRLIAAGFFTSFTVPKLYSCYSSQIHIRAEILRDRILEAWKSCPRKKLVAATAITMCWNMFSVKTRVMAAFISLVVLRYNQKYRKGDISMEVGGCQEDQDQIMEMDE